MEEEIAESYRSSLSDLTINSKPLINMLTMLAEDHEQFAGTVVQVIEEYLHQVTSNRKLPVLYLIDSIVKNLPHSMYPSQFSRNIVKTFCDMFNEVDEKTRQAMFKLRQTWGQIFKEKLYELDTRVHRIDPAWPVTAEAPATPATEKRKIHVNPKFLKPKPEEENESSFSPEEMSPPPTAEELVDQDIEAKKQQLQQLELKLQLAKAQAKLDSKKAELAMKNQQRPAPPQPTTPALAATPVPSTNSKSVSRDPRLASRDPRLARQMSAATTTQADTTPGSAADFMKSLPASVAGDSSLQTLPQPFPQQMTSFPSTAALTPAGVPAAFPADPALAAYGYQQPFMPGHFQPHMEYPMGMVYPVPTDSAYPAPAEGPYSHAMPPSQPPVSSMPSSQGAKSQRSPPLHHAGQMPGMERQRVDPRTARSASAPRVNAQKTRSPSPKPQSVHNKPRSASSKPVTHAPEVVVPSPKEVSPPPKEKTPPRKQEVVATKEKTPLPKTDELDAAGRKGSPNSNKAAEEVEKKVNVKEEKAATPPASLEKENGHIKETCPPSSPDADEKGSINIPSAPEEKLVELKNPSARELSQEEKAKDNKAKTAKPSSSSEKLQSKKHERPRSRDARRSSSSEKSRRDSGDSSDKKDSSENRAKHGDRKSDDRGSSRDRPWRIPRRTHRYDSDEDRGRRSGRSSHRHSEERLDRDSRSYGRGGREDRRGVRPDRDRSPLDRREDRSKDLKPVGKATPLLPDPKPAEAPMDVDERSNTEVSDVDERSKNKRPLPRKVLDEMDPERKRPRIDSGSDNSRDIEDLFGGEDVDYRSRRPSKGMPTTGWNQFKAERPKEFSMEYIRQKSREINEFQAGPQDVDLRAMSRPKPCLLPTPPSRNRLELPKGLNQDSQEEIIHKADKLLQAGTITHEQHQEMLRQLDEVYAEHHKPDLLPHGRPRGPMGAPVDIDHRRMPTPDEDLRRGRGRPLLDHPGDIDDRRMRRSPPQVREDSDMRHFSPRMDFGGSPRADFGDSDMRGPRPELGKPGFHPDSQGQDMDMRGMAGPRPRFPPEGPMRNGPGHRLPPASPHVGGMPERGGHPMNMPRRPSGTPFQHSVGEGTPMDDPRWSTMRNAFLTDAVEEVVIDGRPYEINLGGKARRIRFGKMNHFVYADPQKRAILIDDVPMYKFGEDIKDIQLDGHWHKIYYHGSPKVFWIDGQQHEVRIDAPPWNIILDGTPYGFQIDGRDMMVLVDHRPIGPYGGPPRPLPLKTGNYEIRFDHPPKNILVDGESCELKLDRKIPILMYKGKPHAVRFDGVPRDIIIDGQRFNVPMDVPIRIRLGSRPHTLAFGGPCHEVIIDGKWYEVKFDQGPKDIMVGNRTHSVQLIGPVPSVQILDEVPLDFEEKISKEQRRQAFEQGPDAFQGRPPIRERQYSPEFMQQVTGPAVRFQGGPKQFPGPGNFPQNPMAGGPQQGPGPMGMGQGPQPGPMRLLGPQGLMQGGQGPMAGPQGPMQGPLQGLAGPLQGMQGLHLAGMAGPLQSAIQGFGSLMPSSMALGQPSLQSLLSSLPSMMAAGLPNLGSMVNLQNFQGLAGLGQPMHSMPPMVAPVQMPPNMAPMAAGGAPMQQPPPPQQQQPTDQQPQQSGTANSAPVDVNSLLDKLLAAGLIQKPAKSPPPTTQAPTPGPPEPSAAPAHSVTSVLKQLQMQVSKQVASKKETLEKIPDLSDFASDKLKKFNKGVIQRLYQGIQCSSCGSRFSMADQSTTKYREHLDWHFRQNRKEKEEVKVSKFRKWYYEIQEWYVYEELEEQIEKGRSQIFDQMLHGMPAESNVFAAVDPQRTDIIKCPKAGEGDDICVICGDPFEQYWVDDEEGWQLRDALRVNGKTYHPICYEDAADGSFQEPSPTPTESPTTNPLVAALAEAQAITMGLAAPPTTSPPSSTPPSTSTPSTTIKTEPGISGQEQSVSGASPAPPAVQVKMEPLDTVAKTEEAKTDAALIAPENIKKEKA